MFVAGLHALAIVSALLLVHERPREPASALEPAITSFDVTVHTPSPEPRARQEVVAEPPEPVLLPPIAIELPSENLMSASMIAQEGEEGSGGACDMTPTIQTALRADPGIAELVPTIAQERRSVANALAIWNRVWVEPDRRFPEPALAAIRNTVRETVEGASDACRFQQLRGPRLLYLPIEGSTVVLAMGSGRWTWHDVATTAEPEFLREQAIAAATEGDGAAPGERRRRTFFESLFDS